MEQTEASAPPAQPSLEDWPKEFLGDVLNCLDCTSRKAIFSTCTGLQAASLSRMPPRLHARWDGQALTPSSADILWAAQTASRLHLTICGGTPLQNSWGELNSMRATLPDPLPGITSLSLQKLYVMNLMPVGLSTTLPNLRQLHMQVSLIKDTVSREQPADQPSLPSLVYLELTLLSSRDYHVPSQEVANLVHAQLFNRLPSLRSLDINAFLLNAIPSAVCDSLTSLVIRHSSTWGQSNTARSRFPNLQTLSLPWKFGYAASVIPSLSQVCPRLTSLIVPGLTVTDKVLAALLHGLPDLESLSVGSFSAVTQSVTHMACKWRKLSLHQEFSTLQDCLVVLQRLPLTSLDSPVQWQQGLMQAGCMVYPTLHPLITCGGIRLSCPAAVLHITPNSPCRLAYDWPIAPLCQVLPVLVQYLHSPSVTHVVLAHVELDAASLQLLTHHWQAIRQLSMSCVVFTGSQVNDFWAAFPGLLERLPCLEKLSVNDTRAVVQEAQMKALLCVLRNKPCATVEVSETKGVDDVLDLGQRFLALPECDAQVQVQYGDHPQSVTLCVKR